MDRYQGFKLRAKPDRSCIMCRREFCGEDCFVNHLIKQEIEDPSLKRAKKKWEEEYGEDLSPNS